MPAIWMDVDIALTEVPVNLVPLIDDSDFKSVEEGVTYDQAGMDLYWHFTKTDGTTTVTSVVPTAAGVHDWAHQDHGLYTIAIPDAAGTINNDTEGFGWFTGFATGILPWTGPVIGFRAAALNNALIDGGDTLDVNVTAIAANVITAAAINADAITSAKIADNAIAAEHIAAAAIDNATFAADVGSTAYATNIMALAVRKALDEIKLDHLVAVADADDPVNNSIIAKLAASDGDWSGYTVANESLEALRARGDSAWATAVNVNVASIDNIDFGATMKASITTACDTSCDTVTVTSMAANVITAASINADAITEAKIANNAIAAEHIAAGAIDNATFAADVGSTAYATNIIALSVRKALDEIKLDHLVAVADADDPVNNSIVAKLAASDGDWSGYTVANESLEALRARGDSAWTTAVNVNVASIDNIDFGATMKASITTACDTSCDTVTVTSISAAGLLDFFDTDSGGTYAGDAVAGSVVKEIVSNAGGGGLTEAGIADAVWDEAQADHVAAGSMGKSVSDLVPGAAVNLQIGGADMSIT